MATLMGHDKVVFKDQTVYATGHAYLECEFVRCTIVMKGLGKYFDRCKFESCVWDLDIFIHDREQVADLQNFLSSIVDPTLPVMPPA